MDFSRGMPLTTFPTWKIVVFFLVLFSSCFTGGYFAGRYVYNLGVVAGVEAYHAQCLTGGFLVDDEGQAVVCGPLSKAPPAEKESWKNKTNAPTLF